jgi:hypothetical protein
MMPVYKNGKTYSDKLIPFYFYFAAEPLWRMVQKDTHRPFLKPPENVRITPDLACRRIL